MHGIWGAALVTTALAVLAWGKLLLRISRPEDRTVLGWAFLAALPLHPLAFYVVRLPADGFLKQGLGEASTAYLAARMFYAPVTEELAKLLPLLLIPWIRRAWRAEKAASFALAVGLGFALGEVWLLASTLAATGKFGDLPFYMFGGFMGERLLVCGCHSGFLLLSIRRGLSGLFPGVLFAMLFHFLANLPIFFAARDLGGLGPGVWQALLTTWLVVCFLICLALIARESFGSDVGRMLFGSARCPGCTEIYSRPLWGLNLGPRRYERCPHCRRWHMTGAGDVVDPDELKRLTRGSNSDS